jgi:hypothetical protein
MSQLTMGTGRADITPAPGTPQGIWGAQLHQRGIAADMPLYVTALAIRSGDTVGLIIDVDVIGFDAQWSARILDATAELTGVPRDHIRIAASHTHSGPKTVRLEVISEGLEMAVDYLNSLPGRIAGAAWQAINNLQPVRIAAGTGSCSINVNRRKVLEDGRVVVGRNWDGLVDRTVRVLRIDDVKEKPVAAIVHYACHPTIMAWQNQYFTPDFPGVVRQVVEREVGGTCLFLQGATGSTGPVRGFTGDLSVYRRLGTILGLEAAKVAMEIETLPREEKFVGVMESGAAIALYEDEPLSSVDPVFQIRSKMLTLPANQFPPLDELENEVQELQAKLDQARQSGNAEAIRLATAFATRAAMRLGRARIVQGNATVQRQIQIFRIGDIALVSMQDEPFIEMSLRITAGSPFAHTLVSGYSNGNFGYLPTREAFEEGGYEVSVALYSPDAEDLVVAEVLALLHEMAAS